MAVVVDWEQYFQSIRIQCPWSLSSWREGKIDIQSWTGTVLPLSDWHARVYLVEGGDSVVEAMAEGLDFGEDEWLFSYPGYGPWATPVPVLIQQNRSTLEKLRNQLEKGQK